MSQLICPFCFSTLDPSSLYCSYCGERLSTLRDAPQRFFAVVGPTESGKSHYITILIEQMKRQALKFGWSFFANGDATSDVYDRYYHRPLYENKVTIAKTAPNNVETKRPLIYSLNFRAEVANSASLIFYDASGEIFDSESSMNRAARYLSNSSGVVFIVDPLQTPFVRQRFLKEFPTAVKELPREKGARFSSGEILTRTINFLRDKRNANGKIDVPIAVVFSKIDALRFLLTNEAPCYLPSRHNGFFSLDDFQRNSDYFFNFLRLVENDIAANVFEFQERAFFGVSALGQNPQETQRLQFLPRPQRVLDPILWLLWKNKMIQAQ